jgi:DNA-binding transcriptional regulator/RsmH inhibitor MraZ
MSNQESSLKIDINALGQSSELELWRHKQILKGIAESVNENYADEESVKKVFKNIKYSV